MTSSRSQPSVTPKCAIGNAAPSASFTPGPWAGDPQDGMPGHCVVAQVWAPNGRPVADVEPTVDPAEASANSRLIASAPDGYKLAETILRLAYIEELSTHVEISFEPHEAALILSMAGAVVSKALGGAALPPTEAPHSEGGK